MDHQTVNTWSSQDGGKLSCEAFLIGAHTLLVSLPIPEGGNTRGLLHFRSRSPGGEMIFSGKLSSSKNPSSDLNAKLILSYQGGQAIFSECGHPGETTVNMAPKEKKPVSVLDTVLKRQ